MCYYVTDTKQDLWNQYTLSFLDTEGFPSEPAQKAVGTYCKLILCLQLFSTKLTFLVLGYYVVFYGYDWSCSNV